MSSLHTAAAPMSQLTFPPAAPLPARPGPLLTTQRILSVIALLFAIPLLATMLLGAVAFWALLAAGASHLAGTA